jgi:hypothetical protein
VDEEQLRKRIIELSKQKKNIDKEMQELQNLLVQKLCVKKKEECEPAYCVFRMTDSCSFLDEWRSILKETKIHQ